MVNYGREGTIKFIYVSHKRWDLWLWFNGG